MHMTTTCRIQKTLRTARYTIPVTAADSAFSWHHQYFSDNPIMSCHKSKCSWCKNKVFHSFSCICVYLGLFSIDFIKNIWFLVVWFCFLGVWTYILGFGLVFYVSGLIFLVFGLIFWVLDLYFGFWTCIWVSELIFLVSELILWVSGSARVGRRGRVSSTFEEKPIWGICTWKNRS